MIYIRTWCLIKLLDLKLIVMHSEHFTIVPFSDIFTYNAYLCDVLPKSISYLIISHLGLMGRRIQE